MSESTGTQDNREPVTRMELPEEGINLKELERNFLIQALERTGGNRTRAATLLGINRDQTRYRVAKYGIDAPKYDPDY